MRFSVLIPVFNVERYLPQCLASIDAQTFEDYEVVLVNDGSTDGSGDLCRRYVRDHPRRAKLIEQNNRGLLLARRVAMKASSGDYILCLDSDDALAPHALSRLEEIIELSGPDLIAFQASSSSEMDKPFFDFAKLHESATASGKVPAAMAREVLATGHEFNAMWNKAIRRECAGIEDPYDEFEGLQYGEDLFQMAPILDKIQAMVVIDDILYYYRQNLVSISHQVNRNRLEDIIKVRSRLVGYVLRWDRGLLPSVYANNCVEVLAYCFLCANRMGAKEAIKAICDAASGDFYVTSYVSANLSAVPLWKRMPLRLLDARAWRLFVCYTRALFGALKLCGSDKAVRYC